MPGRTTPQPDDSRSEEPSRPSLSDSLEALRQATRDLAASTRPLGPADEPGAAPAPTSPAPAAEKARRARPAAAPQPTSEDEEAQVYFRRLEQAGCLADIDDDAQIPALSPSVTHVRRPDGTIERIGYSAG